MSSDGRDPETKTFPNVLIPYQQGYVFRLTSSNSCGRTVSLNPLSAGVCLQTLNNDVGVSALNVLIPYQQGYVFRLQYA